jgi:anti-anti-sigma factor
VDLTADMNPEQAAVDNLAELLTQTIRLPRLLLNMKEIDFVTSTFLNRLLVLRRKIQDARGRLLLCNLNPVIQEIFEVNTLGSLFDVFHSESDALGES